jgi:hypothetical protein
MDEPNNDEPVLEEELPGKKLGEMTHMITLTVGINDPEDWGTVYDTMCQISSEMGREYPYVSVSSALTDDDVLEEQDITFNEGTMFKVRHALLSSSLSTDEVNDVVNAMQNDGLVFRERR